MTYFAWVFLVAIGISAPSASLAQELAPPVTETIQQQETESDAGEETAHMESQAYPDITPFLQGIEAAIRGISIREDKTERERQQDQDERDLEAQESMALWAKQMFFATGASVVVTLLGLFLIGFTLYYTKKAADHSGDMVAEAKKATAAALETVVETRRIGEAQTVAYPSIEEFRFELGERKGDYYRPIINTRWKNAGNTPAFDFGLTFVMTVKVDEKVLFSNEYNANVERGLVRIDPGISERFSSNPDDIAFSQYLEELKVGALTIYVTAKGSYRDAFGNHIPVLDHFCSSAIFCYKNDGGDPGGEYIFSIKMAKYNPGMSEAALNQTQTLQG